jgi:hypothetical protein
MLSVANRGPLMVGPNRTWIKQVPSSGTVPFVHVSWLIKKSSTSPVDTRTSAIRNGPVPVFDTMSPIGGLRVETRWFPNSRFDGVACAFGTLTGRAKLTASPNGFSAPVKKLCSTAVPSSLARPIVLFVFLGTKLIQKRWSPFTATLLAALKSALFGMKLWLTPVPSMFALQTPSLPVQ